MGAVDQQPGFAPLDTEALRIEVGNRDLAGVAGA